VANACLETKGRLFAFDPICPCCDDVAMANKPAHHFDDILAALQTMMSVDERALLKMPLHAYN
jgi:hypothetical protein